MAMPIVLSFSSDLAVSRAALWAWMTSVQGIRSETMPYFAMTFPSRVRALTDLDIASGRKLFRSWLLFGGFLPLDYSDLTLVSLAHEQGFLERSPMFSMKLWQHQRQILDSQDAPGRLRLVDTLTFEPRFVRWPVRWLVQRIFNHRHAVLRKTFHGV